MGEDDENRCIICGKKLHNPLALYCPECEYEIKRARLADEESEEEWEKRVRNKFAHPFALLNAPKEQKHVDEF